MNRRVTLWGDLVSRIADAGRVLMNGTSAPEMADMCETLLTGRGEATGLALARSVLERYEAATPEERQAFFVALRDRFGPDPERVARALEALPGWRGQAPGGAGAATSEQVEKPAERRGPDAGKPEPSRSAGGAGAAGDTAEDGADAVALSVALRALHMAAEPRSQELIRRLNRAPGGTRRLVAMRRDLLELAQRAPEFAALDADFRHLFMSWFNRGFLELRRIDWTTSAEVLERVIHYEAVHEIEGWEDLRRRVAAPDRRLYAFFHPAMRDDPLIFVEVALTAEFPGSIRAILAHDRAPLAPQDADVAVFYSISNCQDGLRGISFGNFLIKQVVEEMAREFPNLARFVTLSPLPGLRRWALAAAERGELRAPLAALVARLEGNGAEGAAGPAEGDEAALLRELAAHYLIVARDARGGTVDPVARFHLGNGARLERIHPEGDHSPRGRRASWGVMVNYLYDLTTIEENHEAYSNGGTVIAAPALRKLVRAR